jgi:hypothetical protein
MTEEVGNWFLKRNDRELTFMVDKFPFGKVYLIAFSAFRMV